MDDERKKNEMRDRWGREVGNERRLQRLGDGEREKKEVRDIGGKEVGYETRWEIHGYRERERDWEEYVAINRKERNG